MGRGEIAEGPHRAYWVSCIIRRGEQEATTTVDVMSTRPTYATVVRHGTEVSLQRALAASVPETTIDVKKKWRYLDGTLTGEGSTLLGRSADRRPESWFPYPVGPGNRAPSGPYELHRDGPHPAVYNSPGSTSDVWPVPAISPDRTSDHRYDSSPRAPRRNTVRPTQHLSERDKRAAPRTLDSTFKHTTRRKLSAGKEPHVKQAVLQRQQARARHAGQVAEAQVDDDLPMERPILMLAIERFMTEVQNLHQLLQASTDDAMLDGNETRQIAETAAGMLAYSQKLLGMNVGLLKPDLLSPEQKQALKRDLAEGARLLTHDVQVFKLSGQKTASPIPPGDPLQLSDQRTPEEPAQSSDALEEWMDSVLKDDDEVNAMFGGMSLNTR
jgi:hypothetical protein